MKQISTLIFISFLVQGCSLIGSAMNFIGEETGYQLDLSLLTPPGQSIKAAPQK